MPDDVYSKNIEFLRMRGIELKGTGLMFTPLEGENETHEVTVDEYSYITIRRKGFTGISVANIVTQLLKEDDFK